MTPASLTAIARRGDFVRETLGPNKGFFVHSIQAFAGGKDGDSWCAAFVSLVLYVAYMGAPPLKRTESTIQMLNEARAKGYVVDRPRADDLYFFTHPDGTPHHVGIVTDASGLAVGNVLGIAGNTSEDGTSSNGTGVFEHRIPLLNTVFVRLP